MMTELVRRLMQMAPEEFLGIARLLKVDLAVIEGEKPIPRDAAAIFEDICVKFNAMNRKQKRNFMKLVRTATKGRVTDGPATEDREEE